MLHSPLEPHTFDTDLSFLKLESLPAVQWLLLQDRLVVVLSFHLAIAFIDITAYIQILGVRAVWVYPFEA